MLTHYYRELLNFCLRTLKDRDAAADVTQESYARVLTIQQTGRTIVSPRAVLYQTAQRLMIDMHRRAQYRQHDSLDTLEEASLPAAPRQFQPDELCFSARAVEAYLATIEALPPRCREAFSLHVFENLSHKDIAARMGISLSMVNQYISRGKLACITCKAALDAVPDAADGGTEE